MKLLFPDKDASFAEYTKSRYFDAMGEHEIHLRLVLANKNSSGKSELKKLYHDGIMPFSNLEQNFLNYFFNHTMSIVSNRAPLLWNKLNADHFPIKLIKINRGIDWGWPYTLGTNTIVLSVNFLERCSKVYRDLIRQSRAIVDKWHAHVIRSEIYFAEINEICTTLFHEMIHLLQKNPSMAPLFYETYKKLGFISIKREDIINPFEPGAAPFIEITNPDGQNYQWICQVYDKYQKLKFYLPLLVNDHSNNPTGVIVELDRTDGSSSVDGKWYLSRRWGWINEFEPYTSKFFGMKNQLYHPNEIMAIMISENIIEEKKYSNYWEFQNFYNNLPKVFKSQALFS